MRSSEPIRFGTSVSRNNSETDNVMPWLARLRTMIVHTTQMLNPMCSANIDHIKFFLAIFDPERSQKSSSSGSQCSIQRPRVLGASVEVMTATQPVMRFDTVAEP